MKTIEVDGKTHEYTYTIDQLARVETFMGTSKGGDAIRCCLGMLKEPMPAPADETTTMEQYKLGRAIMLAIMGEINASKNSDEPSTEARQ